MMQFTQKEQEFCWLVGLKAISTKQSMLNLWIKNDQRKVEASQLKLEFMRQFQSGLLQFNNIINGERNKNVQIIKGISDITVMQIVRVIKEDTVKDPQIEGIRGDFQKLITIITYLSLTRSVMSDALMKFCSSQTQESHQYFENVLQNLQKFEQMKNVMQNGKNDPIKENIIYKQFFGKGTIFMFDPFSCSDKESSSDKAVKQQVQEQKQPQQQMSSLQTLQHQVIKKALPQVEDYSNESGESSMEVGNKYIMNPKQVKQFKDDKDSDSEIYEITNFKK